MPVSHDIWESYRSRFTELFRHHEYWPLLAMHTLSSPVILIQHASQAFPHRRCACLTRADDDASLFDALAFFKFEYGTPRFLKFELA